MTKAERAWRRLPQEKQLGQVTRRLVLIDLMFVDPHFYKDHIKSEKDLADSTNEELVDILLFNRVRELREESRVRSSQEIEQQAKEMINMSPDEMRMVFSLTIAWRAQALRGILIITNTSEQPNLI